MDLNALVAQAETAILAIQGLVNADDKEAPKALLRIAMSGVSALDVSCSRHPEIFESMAHQSVIWPGWQSCDADVNRQIMEQFKKLQLGSKCGLNYSRKPWSRASIGTRVALKLYASLFLVWQDWQTRKTLVEPATEKKMSRRTAGALNFEQTHAPSKIDNRTTPHQLREMSERGMKKLKPFDRGNYREWFKAVWPIFIASYGFEFQDHKQFAEYWVNAEKMSEKEQKKQRGLVRRLIKNSILQGLKSIAPKVE
jgi:hypothetical protein